MKWAAAGGRRASAVRAKDLLYRTALVPGRACLLTIALEESNSTKTFSRCWSRLMGRTMVVGGNWNDLDYSLVCASVSAATRSRSNTHLSLRMPRQPAQTDRSNRKVGVERDTWSY